MNNFHKAADRHKKSENHLRSEIHHKTFGMNRIENSLDSLRHLHVSQYNGKVKRNREILTKLLDVTCFLATQELAFRGHDETEKSKNRGNFLELLDLLASENVVLKDHLANSTVFSGASAQIQNDLIDCIATVIRREQEQELSKAEFVSIIVDESTDVANIAQMIIFLRYTLDDGNIYERFQELVDVSLERSAEPLSKYLIEFLKLKNISSKLISQAYDGAAVMSGGESGVQSRIRKVIKSAIYVHCMAHRLNLVMSKSCSEIFESRLFFANLSSIATFFSKSPARVQSLNSFMKKRLPHVTPLRWNYSGRLVKIVQQNQSELLQFFTSVIEKEHRKWDDKTLNLATGIEKILTSANFVVLLEFFQEIFPQTDVLYDVLQSRSSDLSVAIKMVSDFKNFVLKKRSEFDTFWDEFSLKHNIENLTERKRSTINKKEHFKKLTASLCAIIVREIDERFDSLDNLRFVALSNPRNFSSFEEKFPTILLQKLKESYPELFDFDQLETEIKVIVRNEKFCAFDRSLNLFKFLVSSELSHSFKQFYRLVKLPLTLAFTSVSAEAGFSGLKRIKTPYRNTMTQQRLNNLALISYEKDIIYKLKQHNKFYDQIIEIFAFKERRIELTLKS